MSYLILFLYQIISINDMNGKKSFLINLLIFVAGVVLVILHSSNFFNGMTIVCGLIFLVPSIINVVLYIGNGKNDDGTRKASLTSTIIGWITSTGGIVLGLSMLIWNNWYKEILPILFAVILLLGALFQFYTLLIGYRPLKFPIWFLSIPAILTIAGLTIILATPEETTTVLLSGICLMLFSIICFMESWIIRAYKKAQAKSQPETIDPSHQIEDADASEKQVH